MKQEQLIGQLTYNKNTKSWIYNTLETMTTKICKKANKIQSRENYYLAWACGFVNNNKDLNKLILWVEKTNKRD